VNRALGTSGLIGAVDTVVILERKRGEDKGRLLCVSRYDKEIELGLGYKNGRWEVLGDVKEVLISEGQREIIEIIKSLGGEASLDELSKFLNKSKSVLKVVIFNLIQKGIIERTQRGRYSLVKKSINQNNHINFINHINQVNQGRSSMVNVVNDWLIDSINQESLERSKSEGLVNVVNVVNTLKDYKRVL
jgi:predicted transcriptional regulator